MKNVTSQTNTIKKTDLWTAVLLLVLLLALHRFLNGNPPVSYNKTTDQKIMAPFCAGGACLACFCATGAPVGLQAAGDTRR